MGLAATIITNKIEDKRDKQQSKKATDSRLVTVRRAETRRYLSKSYIDGSQMCLYRLANCQRKQDFHLPLSPLLQQQVIQSNKPCAHVLNHMYTFERLLIYFF